MLHPFRTVLMSFFAFSFALTGCGSKTFDSVEVTRGPSVGIPRPQIVNTFRAGSMAIGQRRADAFTWLGAIHNEEQPVASEPRSVTTPHHASPVVTVAPARLVQSDVWACIAEAETGSDWTMHGSTYSTAFGMVNDIIEDYGTPEQQQAVFSGTASQVTQIDIASRFAADHGFGGWGELTRKKCRL